MESPETDKRGMQKRPRGGGFGNRCDVIKNLNKLNAFIITLRLLHDTMDGSDPTPLYRKEYDLLTLERRREILERIGSEHQMSIVGFRRFERWGVYTFTAVFERDGSEFVFVPGDEVTLGWKGEFSDLEATTRFQIQMALRDHGYDGDPAEIMGRLILGPRDAVIPPMLVETRPRNVEADPASVPDIVEEGFSVPTSDEWEYLCGGGTTTLFPWGDRFDSDTVARMFPEGGPSMEGRPNFFGLTIGTDPFRPEIVMSDRPLFRGGDFGGSILSGYGPVMGHLPVCPHFKPVAYYPEGKVPSSFPIRRIIRLDTPDKRQMKAELPEQKEDTDPSEEGGDTFRDPRPFPSNHRFLGSIAADPSVPATFTVTAQTVLRGLTYWIPAGEWSLEELAGQLRSRADTVASIAEKAGYRMTGPVVDSVRQAFADIIGFYHIPVDLDDVLAGDAWHPSDDAVMGYESPDRRIVSDVVRQCEAWNAEGKHQRIAERIESLPESVRTPELTSILARAYNNLGGPEDTAPYLKAISLLESVRDSMEDDFLWNYRMGYAYQMMDLEPMALPYLERAYELSPDDEENGQLLDWCNGALAVPRFHRTFRERAELTWKRFADEMPEIERLLSHPLTDGIRDELISKVEDILTTTFGDVSFEIGYNGSKYELVISPEGDPVRLFEIVELIRRAPETVTGGWDLTAGNRRIAGFEQQLGDTSVCASDVDVAIERTGGRVRLTMHCAKLDHALESDQEAVWMIISSLMERAIGEVPAMSVLDGFDVVSQPPEGDVVRLSELRSVLMDMGFNMEIDAAGSLSRYSSYELEPYPDPDADWRADVYAGSTRCANLVAGYLKGDDKWVDMLHADGAAAGFFIYPLDPFEGEDRSRRILDFRDKAERRITEDAGTDSVEFVGGATGLRYGYIDFIAWDLERVLGAAETFFRDSEVDWASFHSFRRVAMSSSIFDRRVPEPPASPILTDDDVTRFESYVGDVDGMYGSMLEDLIDTVNSGIRDGRFTARQAMADLDVALWYSYACLNIGDYEHHWQAARWMRASEHNASGCGTWFYRYSCALMYCGRLDEAREYAERGILEEPGYPWIWLHTAKLRAHFGDAEGAFDAIARGLEIVPDDYEFRVLKEEVDAGLDLDNFEYHWIDPGADAVLQAGEDPNGEARRLIIDCILTDPEGAERFRTMFDPIEGTWQEDAPYCSFEIMSDDVRIDVVFRTNVAAVSKFDASWMSELKTRINSGKWNSLARMMRERDPLFRGQGTLKSVLVDGYRTVTLVYGLPSGRMEEVTLDEGWEPVLETGRYRCRIIPIPGVCILIRAPQPEVLLRKIGHPSVFVHPP